MTLSIQKKLKFEHGQIDQRQTMMEKRVRWTSNSALSWTKQKKNRKDDKPIIVLRYESLLYYPNTETSFLANPSGVINSFLMCHKTHFTFNRSANLLKKVEERHTLQKKMYNQ